MLKFATFALSVGLVSAVIPSDEVTSLPGYSNEFASRQYSGLLSVDDANGRELHYWLVLSENEPSTDPLVLWLNGGPGCSSLDGFLYEHGPFHFDPTTEYTANPTLIYNEFTWSKIANVLFLEAPAGVGFSFSNTSSDYSTNDEKTATDNYEFLQRFYEAYPELNTTAGFYITGESYAGIYIPTLADTIRQQNEAGDRPFIPLKGIAVGNGCTGSEIGICGPNGTPLQVEYMWGHDLFSPPTHRALESSCGNFSTPNPSAACRAALKQMSSEISNTNIYNIYDDCINGGMYSSSSSSSVVEVRRPVPSLNPLSEMLGGPAACIDGIAAYNYLNRADVRKALHVDQVPWSKLNEWHICTSKIRYSSTAENLPRDVYPGLIDNYRVLIFNGDADACVPVTDNEQWTEGMGFATKQGWRAWNVDNQVAGYVTVYDTPNDFTFLTVKGAGHMVPQYKPKQAFAMFQRFITNKPF